MLAKTHFTFGIACWVTYANVRGIPVQPLPLALVGLGSLLPDIDHPKSTFGRIIPFLSYPISAVFGHRGITHSFLAAIAAAFIMYMYGAKSWFVAPLVVGYVSHVLGDVVTNSGAPLFWPKKDKVSIPVFNTNSFAEYLFLMLLSAYVLWMLWHNFVWTINKQF